MLQIEGEFWKDYEERATAAQNSRRELDLESWFSSMSAQHVSLDAPWVEPDAPSSCTRWCLKHGIRPKDVQQQLISMIHVSYTYHLPSAASILWVAAV